MQQAVVSEPALSRKTDPEALILQKACYKKLNWAQCKSLSCCDPFGQAVGSVVPCNLQVSVKDNEVEEKTDPFCGIKRKKSQ